MKSENMTIPKKRDIFMGAKIELDTFKELEAMKEAMNLSTVSEVVEELVKMHHASIYKSIR